MTKQRILKALKICLKDFENTKGYKDAVDKNTDKGFCNYFCEYFCSCSKSYLTIQKIESIKRKRDEVINELKKDLLTERKGPYFYVTLSDRSIMLPIKYILQIRIDHLKRTINRLKKEIKNEDKQGKS